MVAIARAVQIDARVVIMDEPTSSLEQREVETLFRVIERLRGQGIAIVYVSHRLDELFRICDRVTVMRDGAVVHESLDGRGRPAAPGVADARPRHGRGHRGTAPPRSAATVTTSRTSRHCARTG